VLAHGEGLQAHARAAEMRLGMAESPAAPSTTFEVRPVTDTNVDELIALQITEAQERFVASVAKSLAQASVRPAGRPLGLYANGRPVGLLLLWDARRDPDLADRADQLYIWRLMIDARHQRQGHGQAAMRWLLDEARRIGVASVGLSHVPENPVGPFYARFGFRYTGQVHDGEHEMVLELKS
jgi:GNAT superfamily N-acetyltransferase